jgi:hypothetical protein
MKPVQLDFPFSNNYLEVMRDNEVERWMQRYFPSDDPHDENAAMDDILAALRDNDQSRQIRHYVTALCSLQDEHVVAFCETFLPNYFVFSVLAMIKNKLDPAMDKQTYKFHKKLSSWSRHLEKRSE